MGKAKDIVLRCDKALPVSYFVPNLFEVSYANVYYAVEDYKSGDNYLVNIVENSTEELERLFKLDKKSILDFSYDIQFEMETYRRVLKLLQEKDRKDLFDKLKPRFDEFNNIYKATNLF